LAGAPVRDDTEEVLAQMSTLARPDTSRPFYLLARAGIAMSTAVAIPFNGFASIRRSVKATRGP
jgi:hypothetical protein